MVETMTPSGQLKAMTIGQIDKAVANYRVLLEKHSREFGSEAVQSVLGQPELTDEMFAVLSKRVEAISHLIVRRVKVDRNRTPQQMLNATGRRQYVNREVVEAMPRGTEKEVDVCFFKVDHDISDADLETEYALRGLVPADPYSLAAVNAADPAFADTYPNSTHWKDASDNWCFASFSHWDDVVRYVDVRRGGNGWDGDWWFGGLRK